MATCTRSSTAVAAGGTSTRERLSALLPWVATVANPLAYTALISGEVPTLRDTQEAGAVLADVRELAPT